MNKLILTFSLLGALLGTNAQTISEIKSNSEQIDGRMSLSFYKQDSEQLKRIRSILKLNVLDYYELYERYDTDLKKKIFINSDEYRTKLTELETKKNELKKTLYCFDFEPAYSERKNDIAYDLNSKTFKVSNEIYLDDFYNNPNYVQFDQIVFKCPTGIKINKKRFFSGGVYFINQDIIFKIDEEKLAIKIEENRMSLRLLFVFKFTDAIPFEGTFFGGGKITIYALANNLEKVILYNSGTGEIYQTFK